jgi:hypothetical protein
MHLDRFETRQMVKAAAKKKAEKGGAKGEDKSAAGIGSKNDMKSSKFFSRLQDVAKDDAARKELKRKAKAEGNAYNA